MTKTERARLAKQARRYGYFDTGRLLRNKCPLCEEWVEVDKSVHVSIVRQLDGAMDFHLQDCEKASPSY